MKAFVSICFGIILLDLFRFLVFDFLTLTLFSFEKEAYIREVSSRDTHKLSNRFVIAICPGSPTPTDFAEAAVQLSLTLHGYELRRYPYGIVMPEADRSLHAIFMYERPDWLHCRLYFKEAALALHHLHQQGLVHGDVKLLNLLRHDNHICLADLDAVADMDKGDFTGAKFSSGTLPPEMFVRLESAEHVAQYERYFGHVDRDAAHWERLCPIDTGAGAGARGGDGSDIFVVRSFDERKEGRGQAVEGSRGGPGGGGGGSVAAVAVATASEPAVPYALLKAHPSQDIWALGVLAHTLFTGESLVPMNRDEDLSGPHALRLAATWTDESLQKHLLTHKQLRDPVLLDLLTQLLRVNPQERFQSLADVVNCHPFFTEDDSSAHSHSQHSSRATEAQKDSKFIELTKSKGVIRLDNVTEIVTNEWRFRRLDLAMTKSSLQTSLQTRSQIESEASALLSLTATAITASLGSAQSLAPRDRAELTAKVQEESQNFEIVQNTILQKLVISEEQEQAKAFEAGFPVLSAAVSAQFLQKPLQTMDNVVELYSKATEIRSQFSSVKIHLILP